MQSTTHGSAHADASGPLWFRAFMGHSAPWYKRTILAFLVLNPIAYFVLKGAIGADTAGFAIGWVILLEFIFTLALALKCYPLLPAGLLTLEALVLGLTTPGHMFKEAEHNFPVILLLVFVVAGVNFLKEWLAVVFTAILFSTRSKAVLSLLFCMAGAVLSAFLDALTVTAVIIAVCKTFYDVYNDWRSRVGQSEDAPLEQFRAFLRSLVMHALVGTALGGVMTMVGEPQNLLIAKQMSSLLPPDRAEHWGFVGFVIHMAVVTVPTLIVGLATTVLCEKLKLFGHGVEMPDEVRRVLQESADAQRAARTSADRFRLNVQGACAILLVLGLAFHIAEVGILGLFLIVLATSFTGVSEEHRIGHAFTESLPFTALLVVFFGIVAMIADQDLFPTRHRRRVGAAGDAVSWLRSSGRRRCSARSRTTCSSPRCSSTKASAAFTANRIDAEQFEKLAIAINCGTNVPSIATPNGQAAFLFMLTSALAAPIKLDYVRMIKMALPYTITMTAASLTAVWLWL
jgi:NhaB family Na+:H+ antiporter